jgi:quercetin dioxygenase-like cupin family protein
MKLELATIVSTSLLIGCAGGSKGPAPVDPTDDHGVTEPTDPVDDKPTDDVPPEPPPPPDTGGFTLVKPADLTWTPINPDGTGPEMAVVHGDPMSGPSAFFLRIPKGGTPGVHTHTAGYQAVVVSGTPKHWLAGGGKKAKKLAVGDHWFQPGGQPHDDKCEGEEPCVLFLITDGAFDMKLEPKAKAPKKPGKYKLTPRAAVKWNPMDPAQPDGIKMAVVFGDPAVGPVGFLLEVPPGANAGLHSHTGSYHAVVLDGAPAHWLPHEKGEGEPVEAGTYWFQPGGYDHGDRCTGEVACHAFVFNEGALDFKPAAAK